MAKLKKTQLSSHTGVFVNTEKKISAKRRFADVSGGTEKKTSMKRIFYDMVFLTGFLCCLIPGPFPGLSGIASAVLLVMIAISFFDDNLYLYTALFVYLRYRLLIGEFTAFRAYSFLLAARFITDISKFKLKAVHFPALFVFFMHCMFALARITYLKRGMYVITDCALIYLVMCRVAEDKTLLRRFFFVFILGAIASGIYGWTGDAYTVNINIRGAGAKTVSRNFGALSDSNFAGMIYSLCVICALELKNLPFWLRSVFLTLCVIMLLQTASLSALITLLILLVFLIVLKYRARALYILLLAFVGAVLVLAILMRIPQFRQIEAIAGLLIRFNEKLSYIANGKWDLLTTGRVGLWMEAVQAFGRQDLWHKLIGGNVVTVNYIDPDIMSLACHNSYLQGLLNFGIFGTLLVYLPFLSVFTYRILRHYTQKPGYEHEDLYMLQLCFVFSFIVFGGTVDFFIDWPYMMLYFI
ncbi:MAG: hypothetical protein J1F64_02825 [Oscillospiraceae bacterium]|nr:hypothetical protein [Oscillospiraceae bacterium]